MQVCAISIYVTDLDKGAKFYSEVMGLKINERSPYVVQLQHDGADIVLCPAEKAAQPNYPQSCGVVLGFTTGNLAQSISSLKANKVKLLHDAPQEFPVGHYVAFQDPFGNVHELLEFNK